MTTLSAIKSEIADDLNRSDLTTQIATEINNSILFYRAKRFYFNTTRDETFATVSSQKLYSAGDDDAIPQFIAIDQIVLSDGDELDHMPPSEWEILTQDGSATGKPTNWTYFARSIGLYPIPDDVYTLRIRGHINKAAPASDSEEENVWMTEAYQLIRFRTVARLFATKVRDNDLAMTFTVLERDERARLFAETASREGTGFVTPSDF